MKFDKEISVRSALLGAVVAYLSGPRIGLPPEVAGALGLVVGWVVDQAVFWAKGRLAGGEE